jgi:SSS family solute:Na+ symporter
VIKRNMMALPAYSLLLGLLALLGYVAIAAGGRPITNNATGRPTRNTIIPVLFATSSLTRSSPARVPAIGIGAWSRRDHVDRAANLWTRNIYKEYLRRDATPAQEAKQAKLASLVVEVRRGCCFIVAIDPQFSIDLQLIGGCDHPADAARGRHRALHRGGCTGGRSSAAGCVGYGLRPVPALPHPDTRPAAGALRRLGADAGQADAVGWHPFARLAVQIYVGFVALVLNLVVARCCTRAAGGRWAREPTPRIRPDYHADEGSDGCARSPRCGRYRRLKPFRTGRTTTGRRRGTARPVQCALGVFRRAVTVSSLDGVADRRRM